MSKILFLNLAQNRERFGETKTGKRLQASEKTAAKQSKKQSLDEI
jgi:hypothetical protein